MTDITLSSAQSAGIDLITRNLAAGAREQTLTGPAGSGKTTVMRHLMTSLESKGWTVGLLAPTGRAASRLRDTTGRDTGTIHAALYTKVWEDEETGRPLFGEAQAVCPEGAVIVIDEASMVGSRLHSDLMGHLPPDAKVVWVGDREQLSPVMDSWGPNLQEADVVLTEIFRQKGDSRILDVATALREGGSWRSIAPGNGYHPQNITLDTLATWTAQQRDAGKDLTLLCFSNALRRKVNAMVRQARGYTGMLHDGDTLVCTANQKGVGVMNGETATVRKVPAPDWDDGWDRWRKEEGNREDSAADASFPQWVAWGGKTVLLHPHTLGLDIPFEARKEMLKRMSRARRRSAVWADYGECLTIHKSQGSQWDTVVVVYCDMLHRQSFGDPMAFQRLMYTACTRASKELHLVRVSGV